jgi:hypothetical protein
MNLNTPLVKATTEGVVRAPSEFSRTLGDPPSKILQLSICVLEPVKEVLTRHKSWWYPGRYCTTSVIVFEGQHSMYAPNDGSRHLAAVEAF